MQLITLAATKTDIIGYKYYFGVYDTDDMRYHDTTIEFSHNFTPAVLVEYCRTHDFYIKTSEYDRVVSTFIQLQCALCSRYATRENINGIVYLLTDDESHEGVVTVFDSDNYPLESDLIKVLVE